jgi:hypothetical protein
LSRNRLSFPVALAAVMLAGLGLSACGRNGPLGPPPGPAAVQPTSAAPASPASSFLPGASAPADTSAASQEAEAAKNGFDSHGNPVAGPGQKKSFLLDPLLQ